MASEMQKKTIWVFRLGLNVGQIAALFIGVGTAVVALLFPPYIVCGGFFCGTENAYFQTTAQQFIAEGADEPVHLDWTLFACELFLVLWVTTIIIVLLKRSVTRKSLLRSLIVGEIGIMTIGAARFCLDYWASHLRSEDVAVWRLVLVDSLWFGFWYTGGAVLSLLLLLAIATARLKSGHSEPEC